MGDYSYCTIGVSSKYETNFAAIIDSLDLSTSTDPYWVSDDWVIAEFDQARYGFPESEGGGDSEIWAVISALTEAGIPWRGYDGGGYEWPETEFRWSPELGKVRSRSLDGGGNPTLTPWQFDQILEKSESDEETIAMIANHFGNDPQHWL